MQTIRMEQVKLIGKEQRQGSYTQGKNPQNKTEHTVQISIMTPLYNFNCSVCKSSMLDFSH